MTSAPKSPAEKMSQQIFPVGAAIGRLEDAPVRSARRRVQDVWIARIQGQTLAEDVEAGKVVGERDPGWPGRVGGQIVCGLPNSAVSADVHHVGVSRVANGYIDSTGHDRG